MPRRDLGGLPKMGGGSHKAWGGLVGWSGSSLIAGQAELDLGPESVSPSPVLLQSLGRTPEDPPPRILDL